jgi:hypothetical protein
VKIRHWKQSHLTTSIDRNFIADQEALLAAVILDRRLNAWAREMLRRRSAVARWRGQSGCSVREIIQTLDALPTRSDVFAVVESGKDEIVRLRAA